MPPKERAFVLAVTAYGYAHALQAASGSPIEGVARQLGLRPAQVRERFRTALHMGLLSAAPRRGRAVGGVTAAGMDAINSRVERILAWHGIQATGNLHLPPDHEAEGLASAARTADLYDRQHPGLTIAEVLQVARARLIGTGLPADYQPTSLQVLPPIAATFTPAE